MIKHIERLIRAVFIGDMGIKTVKLGDELIHQRQGGYFYITLK